MHNKLVSILVAGLIGLVLSPAAQAQYVAQEGFEGNNSNWTVQGGAGFDVNRGFARTGQNNAWVRGTWGWNAIQSSGPILILPPGATYICRAAAFVRTSGNVSNVYFSALNSGSGSIRYENVYSGTGTLYPSGQRLGLYPDWGGIGLSFEVLADSPRNIQLSYRLGFWGNGTDQWAQIDDLLMWCEKKK